MGRHIFFTDIDGTLLRGDMTIPPAVIAAAARFVAAGGMIALATGRSPVSTAWIARALAIDIPCILYSGAVIYDFSSQRIIAAHPLPGSVRNVLANVVTKYPDISVQAYTSSRAHVLQINDLLRAKGVKEELESVASAIPDADELLKIVLTCDNVQRLEECGARLFSGDDYQFAFASTHFAEVVARGADKGSAVRQLAALLNIPLFNTFAAGDAMTDYSLLSTCAFSFATADAPSALQTIADVFIPPCTEGGMAEAFDRAAAMIADFA